MLNKVFGAIDGLSFTNEDQKDLVRGLTDLSMYRLRSMNQANADASRNDFFSGIDTTFKYEEMSSLFNKKFIEYCAGQAGIDAASVASPLTRSSTIFKEKMYQIVSLALPTVISAVTQYAFGQFADVRNVGWGDTAHFTLKSREIFTVNTTNILLTAIVVLLLTLLLEGTGAPKTIKIREVSKKDESKSK